MLQSLVLFTNVLIVRLIDFEWRAHAVMDSWNNVTSEVDYVITAVRGNMAVIPCHVTWSSRPPATLQFQRDSNPLTTLSTSSSPRFFFRWASLSLPLVNPLECRGYYSATPNNMKLVHWPLMGGRLRLVHRERDWQGRSPPGSSWLYQMKQPTHHRSM